LAFFGTFCVGSEVTPGQAVNDARCVDANARRILASFEVAVESPDEANRHPRLTDDAILLNDAAWAPSIAEPSPWSSCDTSSTAPDLPVVKAGSGDQVVSVKLSNADREPLEKNSEFAPSHESLLLSHYSTAGELARSTSVIEGEISPQEPVAHVNWTAPTKAPAEGQPVRFYFVLRDGRGGAIWSRRVLCVTP